MRLPDPKLRLFYPARTFTIDGAADHPVLPFVQQLQQEKFKVTSEPGQSPIALHYGNFWRSLVWEGGPLTAMVLPQRLQRWELDIDVLVEVKADGHGNHAVTVTGHSWPRRGNNFLFETVAGAAEALSRSGSLLRWSDFFEGDAAAMKNARKLKRAKA